MTRNIDKEQSLARGLDVQSKYFQYIPKLKRSLDQSGHCMWISCHIQGMCIRLQEPLVWVPLSKDGILIGIKIEHHCYIQL